MENKTRTIQDILGIKFAWYDYSFFASMLIAGALIGIYYGFYKKQQTAKDYLLGGKSLGIVPLALSLTANNVSGITMLAVPSDVYKNGISFWFTYITILGVIFTSYKVFVPVFAKLQRTSTFEYLKMRFDTKTRLLGSSLCLLSTLLYLPVVIYIPALALSQATGINLHITNVLVCTVCVFYTSVGGLKAAVYTDALYSISIILSLVIAFTLGVIKSGGIANVWTTSYESDRLTLTLDMDFTIRNSIWAVTIGQFITWMSYMGVYQVFIQKCLAVPTNRDLIKILIIFAIGIFSIGTLANFTGLIMFTEYANCDPLTAGILHKQDQLVPYYILDIGQHIPGLAGLFIAGVFGAGLSTLSGCLNSLSCTIYEDFISRYVPHDTSEKRISVILKSIVIVIGIAATAMVLVVEKLGGILALTNSLAGITSGPILGLFVGGMLIPTINEKGAYYGNLLSMIVMSVIVFGAQWYQNSSHRTNSGLPVSIEGCSSFNFTLFNTTTIDNNASTLASRSDDIPFIYRIAFYWYCTLGLVVSLTFAFLISSFYKSKKQVHKDLLSPVIHRFLSKEKEEPINFSEKLLDNIKSSVHENAENK